MMKYTCVALFSCCVLFVVVNSECGKNEELGCVHSCPPQKSCSDRDIQIACPDEYTECEDTCVCQPGFIRNDNNDCITEDQCDKCTKENEFHDCGELCDNVCATLSERNRTHCDLWISRCVRQCYCKDGYARDENRNCIPVDKCPETTNQEQNA